jgi:hypothetical protein
LGFRKVTSVPGGKRPIMLHLLSEPLGREDYMCYRAEEHPD